MSNATNTKFRKNISTFSLMMTGVTAIIGSGWLLSTQKIANVAGPAGILSWVLGAVVALLVGLLYVEIGSAYPSSGGIGYYSHVTHGRFCGFLTSWINWLSIVAVAPIEAQSIVQYLSQLTPTFNLFYDVPTHNLTHIGIGFALLLMLLFTLLNYWSVRLFIRFNDIFTIIKVVVPILTIIALIYSGFHSDNFTMPAAGGFMPFGIKAILTSVVSCGVVMSFNGFQSPLTFSEEIKSPKTMLPIAVVGSILFTLVLYVVLQVVFIGGVDPKMVASLGWHGINLRSPYVDLLLAANLQLMVTAVYVGSVISPGVCGAAFVASSSRILFSLSREQHLPKILSEVHPLYQNPRNATMVCMVIGCIFLFLFRGWYELVAVISVIHLFSYLPAPIVVMANRLKNKAMLTRKDQFILPLAHVLAPILLFILSGLLFFTPWPLPFEILVLVIPGLCFYAYYERKHKRGSQFWSTFRGASWLLIYLLGVSLIAFLGNNPHGNAIGIAPSMVLIAILSLFVYYYGVYFARDRSTYQLKDGTDISG